MAGNLLTNLRGPDAGANRQTDAIANLVEPVAQALMATPIMGAPPPPWIQPQLGNGFVPLSAALYGPPRYHRDALRYVHAQASLSNAPGCAVGAVIWTMPLGYRPQYAIQAVSIYRPGAVSLFGTVVVGANGDVVVAQAVAAGSFYTVVLHYLAEV